MSKNYYCYVRDSRGKILEDGFTEVVVCHLNSLDFPVLINHGYSIEIVDIVDFSTRPAFLARCRRISRRITEYILNYNKLPLKRRL